VARAWKLQVQRQQSLNGELPAARLEHVSRADRSVLSLLASRGERFRLSPRRLHRTLRVARTVADLEGSEAVRQVHLDEALHYRPEAAS
jgi:magnesium chelatase family protein